MNILIIGGTGTLGRELLKHYYANHAVYVMSRDELKQQELKKIYPDANFILGDVRDGLPLIYEDIDVCYYVAALKHIDVLENNVNQAIQTNVIGLMNCANDAIELGIPRFAFCSTDKAVFPVNVYGHTKALGEKYLASLGAQELTWFRTFRWGNVIGSRGSVVQAFAKSLQQEKKIYLTHEDMTRFWIRVEDAVQFMVGETETPTNQNNILIPKMKSSRVLELANAIAARLDIDAYDIVYTGLRPGEKIHEHITHAFSSFDSERYTSTELFNLLEEVEL